MRCKIDQSTWHLYYITRMKCSVWSINAAGLHYRKWSTYIEHKETVIHRKQGLWQFEDSFIDLLNQRTLMDFDKIMAYLIHMTLTLHICQMCSWLRLTRSREPPLGKIYSRNHCTSKRVNLFFLLHNYFRSKYKFGIILFYIKSYWDSDV